MSHDLATFRNGDVSFYSAREPAWHRLGTVTTEALNAKDALKAAHLDGWDIRKQPLTTVDAEGRAFTIPGRYATVRRNPDPDGPPFDALGVVGEDYQVVQNEEAFDFLTGLVDDGEATFETAGALKGVGPASSSRCGSRSRCASPATTGSTSTSPSRPGTTGSSPSTPSTPVRIVCQNTLSIALRGARSSYVVRHDRGAAPKVAEARSVLKVTLEGGDTMGRAARAMLSVPVSESDFMRLVERHFVPDPEKVTRKSTVAVRAQREDLRHLAFRSPTQDVGRGTAWGAFNSLSEWSEWVRPAKVTAPGAAESVLMGSAAATRQKAWDLLAPSWAARRVRS